MEPALESRIELSGLSTGANVGIEANIVGLKCGLDLVRTSVADTFPPNLKGPRAVE
jgi:hypothetical protein